MQYICNNKQIILTLNKFQAFRLADQFRFSHALVADEMEISCFTFTRFIGKAREKVADFIIQGKLLTIEDDSINFWYSIKQR